MCAVKIISYFNSKSKKLLAFALTSFSIALCVSCGGDGGVVSYYKIYKHNNIIVYK